MRYVEADPWCRLKSALDNFSSEAYGRYRNAEAELTSAVSLALCALLCLSSCVTNLTT